MRRFVLICTFGFVYAVLTPALAQEDPGAVLRKIEALMVERQFDAAGNILDEFMVGHPMDVRALNLKGVLLTATGNLTQANSHFEEALTIQPSFYPALKNLALNELKLNQTDQAKKHFTEVLDLSPEDPVAHLSLAEIAFAEGDFHTAAEHYPQTGTLLQKEPYLTLKYAQSCMESAQDDRAISALASLTATDSEIHFQAGLMLGELRAFEESAVQFKLAQTGYPNPYAVGFNLVLALIKGRDHPGAIESAEALIQQGHETAELYNLVSDAYEANGETLKAYEALKKAASLDPKEESHYLDLVVLAVDHLNYDLALEIADIGLSNIPNSHRLQLERGTVWALKGQYDKAVEDFEKVIEENPEENITYFAMSMALMQMDEMERATEMLRQRVAASPNDYLLLYALGESLNRAGIRPDTPAAEEALRVLQRSVRLNPSFGDSRVTLGKILLKIGALDEAIEHLEKALTLNPEDLSPTYSLAMALRRKGETTRSKELLARYQESKAEERDQLRNRTIVRLIRAGDQQ